jgi:hypothetical protein
MLVIMMIIYMLLYLYICCVAWRSIYIYIIACIYGQATQHIYRYNSMYIYYIAIYAEIYMTALSAPIYIIYIYIYIHIYIYIYIYIIYIYIIYYI